MGRYILKRLAMMIPVLLGVTILVFAMLHFAPGDPARTVLGESASEADISPMREEMGLNDPLPVQFARYVGGILQGDFGTSYVSRNEVLTEIMARYPTTMLLAGLSVLVMVIVGIPTGIISAVKQYSWMDNASMLVALTGVSMPTFWTGMLLIMVFSLGLGWFPPSGFYGPIYWVLPAITVGFNAAALITRMTRSSVLEVIRQDYIRTARAKGQTENTVIIHHALKNALIPIITVIGLQIGIQLGGAMVTESVFSIPGLGNYMLTAIKARDYPVVQGGVLIIAFSFCFINLLVDLIYAFVDPRIKAQYKSRKKVST